jgi:hypothetical protein
MTTNVHDLDRLARAVVAAALLLAWAIGWLSGTVAIVLAVVAVVLLATAAIGFCPLYRLLGIGTAPRAAARSGPGDEGSAAH